MNLTEEQEVWICEQIEKWYFQWKNVMTADQTPHRLGIAKEQLKSILCEGEKK